MEEIGSSILFYGSCKDFLVGPENENWDAVLFIKHHSVEKFITFSQSDIYLKHAKHQEASLLNFRLLPILKSNINQ